MTHVAVSLSTPLIEFSELNDSELLKSLEWDRGGQASLRSAAKSGDVKAFVAACQSRLRMVRNSPSSYSASLRWSQAAFPHKLELLPLLEEASGVVSKPRKVQRRPANKTTRDFSQRVESLVFALTGESDSEESPHDVYRLLASLELLTAAGDKLKSAQFWRLWRATLNLVARMSSAAIADDDPTVPADVRLIEKGEIPFTVGFIFEGIAGALEQFRAGKKYLARELVNNTDTDGTPHAELVERLPLWLAPLVRVTRLARLMDIRLWTRDQEELVKSVVERAIPLCRPDGRAALSNGLQLQPLPVLDAAAEVFGLASQGSVGSYLRSVRRVVEGKSPARVRPDEVVSMPSNQSDFARFALLRSDWSVNADSVALAHHRQFPQLDVTAAGRPLIHGDWQINLTIGGVPVELAEEWFCTCWQSDPDADYIELQMQGPGKLRVERLVLLSRTQRFLLLADSVSGVSNDRIEYQSKLPISSSVEYRSSVQTREIQLQMKGFRARAFPLAVPQDRVQSTPHDFSAGEQGLVLSQVAQGNGLFAPIILDWEPQRSRGACQWRTLTITEDGRVIGNDIAAGHRLKIHDFQLLVYRSLKSTGCSRAVLGHHTWNETVVARVDKKGDVDPFLMVES